MHKKLTRFISATALLFALATVTFGQSTAGAVTGSVLDSSGAALANATVTLRSKTTGQTLTTQTTDAGAYSFPNVPVGDYSISFEQTGFEIATQDLKVVLNSTLSIFRERQC